MLGLIFMVINIVEKIVMMGKKGGKLSKRKDN